MEKEKTIYNLTYCRFLEVKEILRFVYTHTREEQESRKLR